jgi:prolyl-tRNA synthetase
MKVSHLFTRTLRDAPADEVSKNAILLIRAGYIYKEMAGVYDYLPLGLMVLENIKRIVREEMNGLGAQELIMSSLQAKATWEKTGRWNDETVDIWFKSALKDETEVGLGWSHEEPIVQMLGRYVSSYRDLPVNVYQFQNKLRNELRAKSGIMRGREFVMKDMYSASRTAEEHELFYNQTIDAYKRVFERLGLADDTFVTFASGGAFTQFSHEFQTICDAGEDVVYLSREKGIALNEEVLTDETLGKLGVTRDELTPVKTAEVGNIFNFGTQKSQDMGFTFTDETGSEQFVHLGSYGIGITRLMGVIAEKFSDEKGLVWPEAVAPFKVALVRVGNDDATIYAADEVYKRILAAGISVLYDDRDARPGEKFADSELMGLPHRVVVSPRSLEKGGFEYQKRTESNANLLTIDDLLAKLN